MKTMKRTNWNRIRDYLLGVAIGFGSVILVANAHCQAVPGLSHVVSSPAYLEGAKAVCEVDLAAEWWHVKNCKFVNGGTLDDVMNIQGQHTDELGHCGEWGPWIQDQNGNVMYRLKNPECPKHPAPKGTGNYSEDDLRAIGKDCIPESERPRTLRNYVTPQWVARCAKGKK